MNLSPSPFDSRWFTYSNGKTFGPYTGHAIRDMADNGQILPSDLVAPVGSSSWSQAKDDPVLRLLFVSPGSALKQIPQFTAKKGRQINHYAALLILGALLWMVWPYYAVYDLAKGLKNGDEAILQSRVDWESVRQSLRGDLNASLLKSATTEQNGLGRGLALVLGPTFVNQIVDGYVTPQAISRLVKAKRTSEGLNYQNEEPAGSELQKTVQKFSAEQITYAFFYGGPLTFRLDVRPKNRDAAGVVTLMFGWAGDWRLSRVTLPLDDIEKFSAEANSTRASPRVAEMPFGQSAEPSMIRKRQPLSQAEISAMRSRLASLWNIRPSTENAAEQKVTIRIRLNRERRLAEPPQVISTGSSQRSQAAAKAAVEAVLKGQPYTMLHDESYDEWKYMDIDFDPTQMLTGTR